MRILYYHQHFATPSGATGTRSYEFARRLVAAGHEVTVIAGDFDLARKGVQEDDLGPENQERIGAGTSEGGQEIIEGIRLLRYAVPYSNYLTFAQRSYVFVRFAVIGVWNALVRDYDIVFATSTPLTAAIPGIVARWVRGKPFVFEVRDLWPEIPRELGILKNPLLLSLLNGLEWLSYHSAGHCIGLSPGMVDGIRKRGIAPSSISMIPNASDLDLFCPASREDRGGRAILKSLDSRIKGDDFVAVYSGAHGPVNGLDRVLEAARILQSRGRTDIKILLIGDGKRKPALLEVAQEQGLSICLFHPPISKRKLSRILPHCDLGLLIFSNLPALYYGTSPNKFFDYLASGLPVLCNYPGWMADMIVEHGLGCAVPPDDPRRFADEIERIQGEHEQNEVRRLQSRKLAETMFNRDDLSQKFKDVLEQTYAKHLSNSRSRPLSYRLLDIFVASFAVVLLAPVALVVAFLIYWLMGSPIIYRQVRAGFMGSPFLFYKFRTMTYERSPNGEFKGDNQRLTSLGRFLRASSLDELPQFWNVLKGDMALVGPRPLYLDYVGLYSKSHRERLNVRPGITGWSQIMVRNKATWSEKFDLDVWYVRNRTIWLDIKILFLTLLKVFRADGINQRGDTTMEYFRGYPDVKVSDSPAPRAGGE